MENLLKVKCPVCKGHKGVYGMSERNYPATLPCSRCDAKGEVLLNSLTEAELNPPQKKLYLRDDI